MFLCAPKRGRLPHAARRPGRRSRPHWRRHRQQSGRARGWRGARCAGDPAQSQGAHTQKGAATAAGRSGGSVQPPRPAPRPVAPHHALARAQCAGSGGVECGAQARRAGGLDQTDPAKNSASPRTRKCGTRSCRPGPSFSPKPSPGSACVSRACRGGWRKCGGTNAWRGAGHHRPASSRLSCARLALRPQIAAPPASLFRARHTLTHLLGPA